MPAGRFVNAILISLAWALIAADAQCASFETLPDGRVVLTVLGEKLAFHEHDLGNVDLYWPMYPCQPGRSQVTLALWRADPDVKACLDKVLPDDYPEGSRQTLTLRLLLRFEDGTRYPEKKITDPITTSIFLSPGHIDPKDLPVPPRVYEMKVSLSSAGRATTRPQSTIDGPPDSLGYQVMDAGKRWERHLLSASGRLGVASKPVSIACSEEVESNCSFAVSSSDNKASIGIGWLGPNPRADWKKYDLVLRKLADLIFIAKPPGDVQ